MLRVYWRWMQPATYLFPGTVKRVRADVPISPNSVWLACRQAAQAAGISKRISPHSLRHYLPFLTMSSDREGSWRSFSNCRSQRESSRSITRHSFLRFLCSKDY